MPEIEIDGEKKKVACGPCIRGHRSSKCQHTDRLLIEVRKPGRPLSACPHPAGSCSCERMVVNYAIPKNAASHGACPTPVATALSPISSVHRVQKARNRKPTLTDAGISAIQKVVDNGTGPYVQAPTPAGKENLDGLSTAQASIVIPDATNPGIAKGTPIAPAPANQIKEEIQTPKTRLGMMGIGGYRAAPDEIGWTGSWPDPYHNSGQDALKETVSEESLTVNVAAMPPPPPKKSCCGRSSSSSNPSNAASLSPMTYQNTAQASTFPTQPGYGYASGGFGADQPVQPINTNSNYISQPYPLGGFGFASTTTPHSHVSGAQNTMDTANPHVGCTCGDTCSCFACPVHPNNQTTTAYVLYHSNIAQGLSRGSMEQIQWQPQWAEHNPSVTLPNMPDIHNHLANNYPPPSTPLTPYGVVTQNLFTNPFNQSSPYIHDTPIEGTGQWNIGQSTIPPQYTPMAGLVQSPTQPNTEAPFNMHVTTQHMDQTQFADSRRASIMSAAPTNSSSTFASTYDALDTNPYTGNTSPEEANTPTLSPSHFLLNQYVVPGCDDATGSCQCGEGCECTGCLTHRGHTGVSSTSDAATSQAEADVSGGGGVYGSSCCGTNFDDYSIDYHDTMLDSRLMNGAGYVPG